MEKNQKGTLSVKIVPTIVKNLFKRPKTVLIGTVCSLPLPYLQYILNPFAAGFIYKCGVASLEGKEELPKLEHFDRLWVTGFLAMVVGFIYSIPTYAAMYINVSFFDLFNIFAVIQRSKMVALIYLGVAAFYFFRSYLVPIAILHSTKNNRFGAAFDFRYIIKKSANRYYLCIAIVFMIYNTLMSIITFSFLNIMGILNVALPFRFAWVNSLKISGPLFALLIVVFVLLAFVIRVIEYTLYGRVLKHD